MDNLRARHKLRRAARQPSVNNDRAIAPDESLTTRSTMMRVSPSSQPWDGPRLMFSIEVDCIEWKTRPKVLDRDHCTEKS